MAAPSIPGYTLGRVVGRGGRSVVYAAVDDRSGSPVAVKVLNSQPAPDAKIIRLFRRELRAGLSVRNRHVVRILGGNGSEPPYFLVMELLPGESLRQRLARVRQLTTAAAVTIARQVASGLEAMHAVGFVHADVKPENVRLHEHRGVKLVDLGFAHRPGDDDALHATGTVMGTANYLAPELCARKPADGFATDVFSLGVMLFEMLTGVLPYPPGTTSEVVRRHRDDPPEDLAQYGDFPLGVVRATHGMLATEPRERYSARTAALVLAGLQAGLTRRAG